MCVDMDGPGVEEIVVALPHISFSWALVFWGWDRHHRLCFGLCVVGQHAGVSWCSISSSLGVVSPRGGGALPGGACLWCGGACLKW